MKILAALILLLSPLTMLAQEAYAVYTESNKTLTFYYDNQKSSRQGTKYDIPWTGDYPGWTSSSGNSTITTVNFDPSFDNYHGLTSAYHMFIMHELTSINNLERLHTENVTDMRYMFFNCSKLESLDVSDFNTVKVTNMNSMFGGCSSLESIDVSGFNTENVTDMGYMFSSCSNLKSLDVSNFNTENVTNMSNMFFGCSGLTSLDMSGFNTENVTDMGYMFYTCSSLTSLDVSNFNTEKVTNMQYMFSFCSSLTNLDVSNFNTENVKNMSNMFGQCSSLTTIICDNNWYRSSGLNSAYMFSGCTSLKGNNGTAYDDSHINATYARPDVAGSSGYFTEKIQAYAALSEDGTTLTFYYDTQRTSRSSMTYGLNSGVEYPGWIIDDTNENVTNVVFDSSFKDARPTSTFRWFTHMKNISSIQGLKENLNTSEVTTMIYMFYACSGLTSLDLSGFNTSKVTDTYCMFEGCSSLTSLDVSSFNTSNVKNMGSMFSRCSSLTSLDVSNFNTEKVTNMGDMFAYCSSLKSLDLSNFNTENVTDMAIMFQNCSNLKTIYCSDNWNKTGLSSISMFKNCTSLVGGNGTAFDASYTDATYARLDEPGKPGYFTLCPYAVLSTDGTTLTFYYDTQRSSRQGTKYTIPWTDSNPGRASNRGNFTITTVNFDPSFDNYHELTTTYEMFYGLRALTTINNLEYLHTENVTDMRMMFYNCTALTSIDVSGFNTDNVTEMTWMFRGCSALTTIYCDKNWNRSSGLTSTGMFSGCESLVGGSGTAFDASHTDATYARPDAIRTLGYFTKREAYAVRSLDGKILTFYYDSERGKVSPRYKIYLLNSGNNDPGWVTDSINADITKVEFDSSFKDARPTSTYRWFYGMSKLTFIADMKEYLNTREVTTMSRMFYNCSSLESLDVSGFNTEKVTDMTWMFQNCSSLTTLDVSGFNTEKVTNMGAMFNSCSKLTILDLSNFNTEKVTDMKYMFSNCSSLTTIICDNDWNKEGLTSTQMFNGCKSLVGGNGTTYNYSNRDATYAHPDATDNPGYFTAKAAYAALDGTTLTFYYDAQRSTRGTTYDLNRGANYPGWYTDGKYANVTNVVFDSSFRDAHPTSIYCWFYKMSKLTSITGMKENLNTSEVTTMSAMFYNCSSLESLDVSGFNTENVTDMRYMFYNCSSLTSLDVSGFDTRNVTDMYGMFAACNGLTAIDVSGFNTAKVTYMDYMFSGNSKLTTIICDDNWYRSGISSADMFLYCTSLKGGNGTVYNSSNVTATYAHPDTADNPGYFTKFVLGDANGDGHVTITDAVAVVNNILGSTQGVFIKRAADVDGNGDISITDAVGIVNIILNSNSAGVKERQVREEVESFREPE